MVVPQAGGRLPDFVIVGAMKSGTTSLYRWLGDHPRCRAIAVKEPNFFSSERAWARGPDWYLRLFASIPAGLLTGEASVSYTAPDRAEVSAERMARVLPGARIVYVVRDPVERLRSHYRHEVQRGRERRRLADAVAGGTGPYVGSSLYSRCIGPYLDRFGAEQVCIVRFEDVVGGGDRGWPDVLAHLGLEPFPRPGVAHNVTSDKRQYGPLMRRLWDTGAGRGYKRLPRPLRRAGRALLTRAAPRHPDSSRDPIPESVLAVLGEDAARLEALLRLPSPLWPVAGRGSAERPVVP